MPYFFLLIILTCSFASCAQVDTTAPRFHPLMEYITVPLGEGDILIKKYTYDSTKPYFFLQLHDNEATSEEAAIHFLERHGGVLWSLENNRQRNVSFKLQDSTYTFDPNRIFSDTGIIATLKLYSKPAPHAVTEVQQLAQFILNALPDTALLIALHNNTEAAYSINSYIQDTAFQKEARAVYVNDRKDPDDFFVTTDTAIFMYLKNLDYNVMLQENEGTADDGSLSVYYGKRGKRYINVEAQHGHLDEQKKMIQALKELFPLVDIRSYGH